MPHNLRLPAEWEPQAALLLTWPQPHGAFGPRFEAVEAVFCEIAALVSQYQKVLIGIETLEQQQGIEEKLTAQDAQLANIHFYQTPSNDVWARDHGPITVYREAKAQLLDFQFNGWGQKYPADKDNQIIQRLVDSQLLPEYHHQTFDWILEGGGIESDGAGTLLTTTSCLLNPNRNPNFSQEQIRQKLTDTFGLKQILWLTKGTILGDDTDGHIDTLARFLNPETIAYVPCSDTMLAELEAFRTLEGKPYTLIPLPIPKPVLNEDADPLPATYANFLITNKAVLVPTYNDPYDSVALHALKPHFPNHRVIGVNCLPIIEQYGSLHCLTMQIPTLKEATA